GVRAVQSRFAWGTRRSPGTVGTPEGGRIPEEFAIVPTWHLNGHSTASPARCERCRGDKRPARAPDLTAERERPPELDSDLRPRLRAPVRMEHHTQNAVDAEPGMPETGVGVVHFPFGPRASTSSGQHSYANTSGN